MMARCERPGTRPSSLGALSVLPTSAGFGIAREAGDFQPAPERPAASVWLGRRRRVGDRQLAGLGGPLDVRRVLRRASGRVRLETRRGGARLLLELAAAPRLLAGGRLALRPLGGQGPGARRRSDPRT